LAERYNFARPLVNSGRLSVPCIYDGSPLNGPGRLNGPRSVRVGAPCVDAPLQIGFLLGKLGDQFTIMTIDCDAPDSIEEDGITATRLALSASDDPTGALAERYLKGANSGIYLIRPDQHVAARWPAFDETEMRAALRRATAKD
jgi:3-(3-hydroxy-phenyl)propionate hydroxylase